MSKVKAVFDTQLFLRAASNLRSLPAKLLLDMRHHYQLIASEETVREVVDVLNRPALRAKFPLMTDAVVKVVLELFIEAVIVKLDEILSISRDPKDDIFLACAKAAQAQYIVSEDKDLLVLNPYEDIQIVNAQDFLRILQPPPEAKPDDDA